MGVARIGLGLATLTVLTLGTACRSFHARYIDPDQLRHGNDVGGVPVRFDRPRWLRLTYQQKVNIVYAKEGTAWIEKHKQVVPSIAQDYLTTAEYYAVDFERPFSGTSNHTLSYNSDGTARPLSLAQDVNDSSFKDIMKGLTDAGFAPFAATGDKPVPPSQTNAETSLVSLDPETTRIEIYDLQDIAKCIYRPVLVRDFARPTCEPACTPCVSPRTCCPPPPAPPCWPPKK